MSYILVDSPNPYTAQGTYPRRGGFKPSGTIIVHTSEGAWTAGVDSLTNLVRTRSDYGCYHRACDWQDIATYYPWEWECWQDSETNNWAVGIAAACRTTDWGNMPADVEEGFYRNLARMAADFVAYMQAEYGVTVPLRRITGAQARARVPGFAAHGDSGVARSDPGANFDWGRFFNYTSQALTGSLSYASESITPLEDDDLTPDQFNQLVGKLDELNAAHHVATREHVNGKTQEILGREPLVIDRLDVLNTAHHVATREHVNGVRDGLLASFRATIDLLKPSADAGTVEAAERIYADVVEKLGNLQINITEGSK